MVDAHRGAFEYDWRTRFSQEHGLGIVGHQQSWGEAIRMYRILANDPSSQVFAAAAGWDFPVSREWIVMADHRDSSEFGRMGKRATRYPRPWPDSSITNRGVAMAPDEFRAVVAATQAYARELEVAAATEPPSDPEGSV